jgi:hypothetical protein
MYMKEKRGYKRGVTQGNKILIPLPLERVRLPLERERARARGEARNHA